MDRDTMNDHAHPHDSDPMLTDQGTAPENEESGKEAMGAGAGDQAQEEVEEGDPVHPAEKPY